MLNRFRSMPATAMTAVLGCAMMTMAAPAAAKEKPNKEREASKATVIPASKELTPIIKKMGDAVKATNAAGLQAALAEADGKATTDGDRYWLAYYKLQLGILNKDKALQAQALDALIDSGMVPAESAATYNFFSGQYAYVDKDYAKAVKRLEVARTAGSTDPSLPLLLMDSYLHVGQVDQGVALAKATIEADRAAGKRPSEELYVRPAQALQKGNRTDEMLDILTMRVQDYGTREIWRNTLFIVLQQAGGDKDLNLDVLRLMRAVNAMTERGEYLEYAALATEAGFPGEVVKLIRQGQAGGVIPAKDERFGSIMESQEPRAKADAVALSADAAKPATRANPRAARSTADALVGNGDYATAITLYEAALATTPDPITQYRLGVAQALAGQRDAAIASFAKVQGNRQRLAQLWTIHVKAAGAPAAASATDN